MTQRNRNPTSEPPLPKPYDFVPLGTRQTKTPTGHHRTTLSGCLRGTLIAHAPVHVASGLLRQTNDRNYPLIKEHARSTEHLIIPSTSLKGCIRSILEAISPAAVTITKADLPRTAEPSRSLKNLDPAQRLFGAMGYQGHVRFADSRLESGAPIIVPSPQLFRPRPESTETYYDDDIPKGRKFYMHGTQAQGNLPLEACPSGSRFSLRADFDNLSMGEIGLLLYALGLGEPKLWPKLGGAKPACLGTLEVCDLHIETYTAATRYTDLDSQPTPQALAPLLDAAKSEHLILHEQLQRLADILRWPRPDRDCPDRAY